jgi:IS4 transposase
MDAAGCRIVTRFKADTPLDCIAELRCRKAAISSATASASRRRAKPEAGATRCKNDTGKVLRILSDDLEASAQEIADLYKQRWAFERFFRRVKQTLKITKFLGTSENAVHIQIAVALAAFLILRLAQATHKTVQSPIIGTEL